MKIQIKQTLDTARTLASSGVPAEVIDTILGKTFDTFGDSYRVPAMFNDQMALWDVPASCCVVLSMTPRKGTAMQRASEARQRLVDAKRNAKRKNKPSTAIYYPSDNADLND